ncbi:MAG: hypothetical protein IKP68_09610 [Clostridia bacterium]|nr:hypothetical protein [Clostridia bacterium]
MTGELEELLSERAAYDDFSAVGLKIEHRMFGSGTISSQQGGYITVSFPVGDKKFMLPTSFTAGFLRTNDAEITELLSTMSELDERISNVRASIREIQRKLTPKS